MKAAVIGLGSMGYGAAVSLLRAGIETTGCDMVEERVERFVAQGGQGADSPAAAAKGAEVILVFVVNASQARGVLFGTQGAVAAADLGTVFVLNATMAPQEAETLAADLHAAGMMAIDAPVSGGVARSEAGELTVIASGPEAAFQKAGPVLDAISSKLFRLGDKAGMGSRMKMVNQLLAGVHVAAMAEAMVLAAREGLDLDTVFEVITQSTGNSWIFENRGAQVLKGDYTPHSPVDVFVKDLGIVTGTADAADVETALSDAALSLFRQASEGGLGRQADAAVAKVLAERAGVKLPGS